MALHFPVRLREAVPAAEAPLALLGNNPTAKQVLLSPAFTATLVDDICTFATRLPGGRVVVPLSLRLFAAGLRDQAV